MTQTQMLKKLQRTHWRTLRSHIKRSYQEGYEAGLARATGRTTPKVVADIHTAPRVPRGAPNVSPDGARMLIADPPTLIPIATLAEPVEKLAGLEILSQLRASRGQLKAASTGFSIVTVA